jgi:hypothetical protein
MAFQINYDGDDTRILAYTITLAHRGEWVVKVTTEDGEFTGPVIESDMHGRFIIAQWDDEDKATGDELPFDVSDVMELEVF